MGKLLVLMGNLIVDQERDKIDDPVMERLGVCP